MNRGERIVVAGAGLAGLRAAERLRELGFEGDIVIVGSEPTPPYHRPALSKQLLQGVMRPNDLMLPAYQNVNAKWRLNTPVQYLLPRSRTLRLPGDEELKYDGLIIATGVEARRQNGVPYEDPRVLVMRTLPDALDFERAMSENRGPIAVVGGGFTGCEIASSLRHMGREVTLIQRGKNLLGNVLGPDLGEWLTKMHGDHGVDLALGNSVKKWQPREDGIALQLSDGSTMLAGCVLLATGTVPSTSWLRGSGLPLDNGVVCEATCHVVGAEDVVAAGDVAQWPNLRFDEVPRRIEHWLNAIEMGRAAAENLLAGRSAATPFTPMPRFWTEQYGVRIQAAGVPKLGPDIVALGSPDDGTGTVFGYAKEGRLMGVVGVDCPSSVMAWTESVDRQNPVPGEERKPVDPAAAERQAAALARPAAERPAAERRAAERPAPVERRIPAERPVAAERPKIVASERPRGVAGERPPGAKRGFAAAAERKRTGGRHSLPAKSPRPSQQNPSQTGGRIAPVEPHAPAAAAGPADSSGRMHPAAANATPPVRPERGGLVDSDGQLVDATGRIGRIDANGDLVSASTPLDPTASYARMQQVPATAHAAPMPYGPIASSTRMRPASTSSRIVPGGRPGPEDSYDRLPAVPPINDRLRSVGGGPADSNGRMYPVDPRMGPESSYDRMPPVDPPGHGAADSYSQMAAAESYTHMRTVGPATGYTYNPSLGRWAPPADGGRQADDRLRGAADAYDRPPTGPRGPVDSYDRLPPVDPPGYGMPQVNHGAWDGRDSGGRHSSNGMRPPADSYDHMAPARQNSHLGPVDSDGRIRPVSRGRGPEDSYDRMPPVYADGRQFGPEDSYDQFPPARRGPLGPVDSNGRLRPVQRRRH